MSLCQPSGLAQFVAKNDQLQSTSVSQKHRFRADEPLNPTNVPLESRFRSPRELRLSDALPVPGQPLVGKRATSSLHAGDWSDEFSRMKIHDPLSFTSEYQQLYASYEKSQHSRSPDVSRQYPPTLQQFPSQRSTLMQRAPLSAQHTHQTSSGTSDNVLEAEYFDREFDELEREMSSDMHDDIEDPDVDEQGQSILELTAEQLKFQQAASEIHQRLSPGPQTPPALESKFQKSKFLGLMRGISDGVVTLKGADDDANKYTQLFSPTSGELVGNEYFPVADATLNNNGTS
ncbi:LADA_0H19614g1_1 [Lachancea dasiensis]|uniref:LADA_0H19614g1_1 n=1 Tax=Lachancea dasiensis TaxID=1072105 RepID=A0A1G4K6E8_9SACH|nr:LADA_0H19614g1_1 [Lachancea dasiensis]